MGKPSSLIARWLLRGYVLFLFVFVLGAGWIAFNGQGNGLSEAGGTASVLSGWLLWGMMMVPLVGLVGLAVGVLAWLMLRRVDASTRVAAGATGSVGALLVSGVGIWFTGARQADVIVVLVVMAVAGCSVAALTVHDARHLQARAASA